ncbi:MAG TPA: DUF1512 domain-containing protein [Nitrososphaerales archaeon]|nr:DUF1512 domain-containing protein [Nitrososphaerales archaeon]
MVLDIWSSLFGAPSGDFSSTVIWILSFVILTAVSFLWAPRIQSMMVLNDVKKNLQKLTVLKDKSKTEALDYLTTTCKASKEVQPRLEQTLEYFTIMPVELDPSGIVGKIEHVTRLQDDRIRDEIRRLAPQADKVQVSVAQNILEVATSLNMVFKIVRHFFIMGQKTKSIYVLIQLQMIMPIIIQEADALISAIDAFKAAQPIGDGLGPMVAGRFMLGRDPIEVERETVYTKSEYKGRNLLVMKAEGPMGTVGRPHIGLEKLVQDKTNNVSSIIMIDAALKLEGENTGEIAEGVGAAIGGIGVEKYRIEAVAVNAKIPLYAVVVKQSLIDAISVMRKEIAEASDKAVAVVQRIIEEKTKLGDTIVIIGVGNTLGVAQ